MLALALLGIEMYMLATVRCYEFGVAIELYIAKFG